MAVISYREALRQAMTEEMERDPTVFLMGEEVGEYNGAYKVSKGMLAQFGPMRVVDSPISEAGFCGLGVGAAMVGMRPIIEMMTWNFAIQAFDQIINHAAKMYYMSGGQFPIPMVIRGPHGAAHMLSAQHSQCVDHMLVNVPGMIVISTVIPADAKGLMKSAIRNNNPVCFLESEMMYGREGEVPDGEYLIPIGVGDIKRKGEHVTLVAWNKMVYLALEVAEELAQEGIEVEVLDPRTLQPLDENLIFESVRKTHRLVVLEEGWGISTIGNYIVDRTVTECFDELDAPPARVHNHFVPMPYNENLEHEVLPNKERLTAAIKKVMYR
ncbi:MAG: pyruvate dehydrogenase complex E1 component subunit beta [Silvanigrellaceae bacterium]